MAVAASHRKSEGRVRSRFFNTEAKKRNGRTICGLFFFMLQFVPTQFFSSFFRLSAPNASVSFMFKTFKTFLLSRVDALQLDHPCAFCPLCFYYLPKQFCSPQLQSASYPVWIPFHFLFFRWQRPVISALYDRKSSVKIHHFCWRKLDSRDSTVL